MSTTLYPKLVKLVLEKNIKLHLQHSKVVKFQSGALALVAPIFGQGMFGIFNQQTGELSFKRDWHAKNMPQRSAIITEIIAVEEEGLTAVARIGLLTGACCICGRTLTADESIAGGIGPICAGKVGYEVSAGSHL